MQTATVVERAQVRGQWLRGNGVEDGREGAFFFFFFFEGKPALYYISDAHRIRPTQHSPCTRSGLQEKPSKPGIVPTLIHRTRQSSQGREEGQDKAARQQRRTARSNPKDRKQSKSTHECFQLLQTITRQEHFMLWRHHTAGNEAQRQKENPHRLTAAA
jgi:hypothetical protein